MKTKFLTLFLIAAVVTAVAAFPAMFSVSYARWTQGGADIGGTASVGNWESGGYDPSVNVPFECPENFGGGALILGSDGKPFVPPEEYVIYDEYGNEKKITGFLGGPNGGGNGYIESDGEFYIQVFALSDFTDPSSSLVAVNYPLFDSDSRVTHEDGSYWYKLPGSAKYQITVIPGVGVQIVIY